MPDHSSDADTFSKAVMMGEPKIVRSALAHGVDVNTIGEGGTPPIVLAVAKGHEAIVDLLLDAGADVNRPDRGGGMTALHAAILNGLESIARKLIERGTDVNASFGSPPITPLSLAFRQDHRSLVKPLLAAGAVPDVGIDVPDGPPEQRDTTPLLYAAAVGDTEMLRLLLSHGADPNRPKADGMVPLMAATFRGQFESVKVLVEAGANVNQLLSPDSNDACSALDLAVRCGHRQIADFLRKHGAT